MTDLQPGMAVRTSQRIERMLGGENVYLLVLAAIVGVLGGCGIILFREAIELIRTLVFPRGFSLEQLAQAPWYFKAIPPAAGGIVVGLAVYFLARSTKGHEIPEVINAVANHGGYLKPRSVLVKSVASALAVGTGGSVGCEDPIVKIGSGLGSGIGQALGFEGNRLIILLGCGAASGIAATFNAPIAGVILAIEVIIGFATITVFSPLVVASVAGTVVSRMWFGNAPAFIDIPEYAMVSAAELPLYIVLGIAAGFVAWIFIWGISFLEDASDRIPMPGWLAPLFGALIVGAVAVVFPQVMGGGYETINKALAGKEVVWVLAALVAVKILATGVTLGSFGAGGVLSPALMVGSCLGGAFGLMMEQLLPGQTASPGAYALVGMGAVLAGATHAPITAIILLFELTANYTIILPLMLSCIISTVLASRLAPASIFTSKLKRKGVRLRRSSESEMMRSTKVRRILRPFPETVKPDAPINEVMRRALQASMVQQYVVDEDGKPLGVITLRRLKTVFMEHDLNERLMVAADVMKSPVTSVTLDTTLEEAMSDISRLDTEMLPVVNDSGQLTGCVTRHDILVFFENEIFKDERLGLKFIPKGRPDDAEFIEVPEGHVVEPIEITAFLNGRTLRELDLRATAGLNVVGIRRRTSEGIERLAPDPSRPLNQGDVIIAVGDGKSVLSFKKSIAG